jgi:D-3-phosphoglycerate dehydrogenase / 2-oxoglutarate reductase
MAPQAQDIAVRGSAPSHHELSVSPSATFHSPSSFPHSFGASTSAHQTGARDLKPFETTDIKILLLENVNQSGQDILKSQGYQVEALKTSLPEEQLIEKIR